MTQQVTRVLGLNDISPDFQRYVHNIEINQQAPVRVTFISLQHLKTSVSYFFQRAVTHPANMKMFAEGVKRIFFVTPINGEKEMNFRKAVVQEFQKQLDDLCNNLKTVSEWTIERAVNTVKFFGEIYNIEFIFHWILNKYLETFKLNMNESLIAKRCFYALIDTVKLDVPRLTFNDLSIAAKSLREVIKETEKIPSNEIQQIDTKSFPALDASKSSNLQIILPPTTFQSIIKNLNKENSKEILKKIANYKLGDNETWQKCYESLIEKALSAPELAEAVIVICKKIPNNNNDSWQKVKSDEYKKVISKLIVTKIEKLFDEVGCGSTQTQVFRILNLIQVLMENSMCSIGFVATFIDILIKCAEHDKCLAAQVLRKLMKIVKTGISAEKIKKIPEKTRANVLAIISISESSAKFKAAVKDIAEYLEIEFTTEEDDNDSESSLDVSFDDEFLTENLENGAIGSPISTSTSIQENLLSKFSSKSSDGSSTSSWNGFSQKFPSFGETLNSQQMKTKNYCETSNSTMIGKIVANNNQMTLSGEWSDLESEIAHSERTRSNASSSTLSSFCRSEASSEIVTPLNKIDAITTTLQSLNLENLQNCVKEITNLKIETRVELRHFVDVMIRNVRHSKSYVQNYAKIAFVLEDLTIYDGLVPIKLKSQFAERCHIALLNLLKPKFDEFYREEIFSLVEFIAELYNMQVVGETYIKICIDELFIQETSCFNCVHCIDIMMRKIGSKQNERDCQMLDRYFNYFEETVANNSTPYRKMVYKNLIQLRKSSWLVKNETSDYLNTETRMFTPPEPTQAIKLPVLETNHAESPTAKSFELPQNFHDSFESLKSQNESLETIAKTENVCVISMNDLEFAAGELKQLLSNSSKVEIFVTSLIQQISSDSSKSSQYAALCKKLIDVTDEFGSTFKEILNENIFKKFAVYVSKQNLEKTAMISFENILIMIAELYHHDIFSDDDLCIWLNDKHTKKISLEIKTQISSIISMKILVNGNKNMMKLLKNMEAIIYDETLKYFSSLKIDIEELEILLVKKQNKRRQSNLSAEQTH